MTDAAAPGAVPGACAIGSLGGPYRLLADPPVTLRLAEARDAASQRAFYLASRAAEFAGLPEPLRTTILEGQVQARQQGYAKAFPDLAAVVLTSPDGLVGQVLLARDPADAAALRLVDIAIAPPWRGRGLGGRTIGHVAGAARAADYAALTLQVAQDNPAARRLYDRLGFVPDGSAPDGSGLFLTMRRRLA